MYGWTDGCFFNRMINLYMLEQVQKLVHDFFKACLKSAFRRLPFYCKCACSIDER